MHVCVDPCYKGSKICQSYAAQDFPNAITSSISASSFQPKNSFHLSSKPLKIFCIMSEAQSSWSSKHKNKKRYIMINKQGRSDPHLSRSCSSLSLLTRSRCSSLRASRAARASLTCEILSCRRSKFTVILRTTLCDKYMW